MRKLALLLLLGTVACGEAPLAQTADQREHRYRDANPSAPLEGSARQLLLAALDVLAGAARDADTSMSRALASHTLARIHAGDVLIGSVQGARGGDRWHMCKDYQLPACEGAFDGDDDWLGDESVSDLLTGELDGYQWGNRLYFSFRDDTEAGGLAETLVHEVNHVLNRSECSYYVDIDEHVVDDTLAYLEEYRAFFGECLYADDAAAELESCNLQVVDYLEGYELNPDLGSVLPDGSTDPELLGALLLASAPEDGWGALVPRPAAWPDDFGPCSCVGTYLDAGGFCRRQDGRFAAATCCS